MNTMSNFLLRLVLTVVFLVQPLHLVKSSSMYSFDLQARGECGFVTLSWNPIPGAESYWIYRGVAYDDIHSMPLTDFPVEGTFYVDEKEITVEQEYFYVVGAVDADNNEFARSSIVSAIPICDRATPVPPIPACKLVLKYQVGNTIYWVNEDSHGPMDTSPIILHSRMFLVIRYVTNPIEGTHLSWDGTERKVTITTRAGRQIELWIGKKDARIDGKTVMIDLNDPLVVPVIVNGRTLLPLRFVGENLGSDSVGDIVWDANTQSVHLFVDDPECEKEGFRYPTSLPLQDRFYEFRVEYYAPLGTDFPQQVQLLLARADNTKELRLGSSASSVKGMNLEPLKTPSPAMKESKTEQGRTRTYFFRMELQPGMLHFYRFSAGEEQLPNEGYFGPVYSTLPHALRLETLNLEQVKDNTPLTLQGFYTSEPYPMLVPDYQQMYAHSEPQGVPVLLRMEKNQTIQEGSFVCLKAQKRSTSSGVPFLKFQKLLFRQRIQPFQKSENEFVMEPLLPSLVKKHRFALLFSGCNTSFTIRDEDNDNHQYMRTRADFTGDMLHTYKTCLTMGLPKNNIFVNFGRGDNEIDFICADDGDGNPFDFEWDDADYRLAMERDAESWWRQDDGWRVRNSMRSEIFRSIAEIQSKIEELPEGVTPEVYVFFFAYGGTNGVCCHQISTEHHPKNLTYTDLMERLSRLMVDKTSSLHASTKIRFSNNTTASGSILPFMQDAFGQSGLDYVQLATSGSIDEETWGQWPDASEASYASAGGSFAIPFRASLVEQAKANPNREVDWKVAYDYAVVNDVYVTGVEQENEDGTSQMLYTHPQYWRSQNRGFYQRGPAYEDPLPPEEEMRSTLCRIGVDTSTAQFDVCNCSMSTSFSQYPRTTFRVVNKGAISFRVVEIVSDESVLSKVTTWPTFIFRANEEDSHLQQDPIDIGLDYNDSHEFIISLHSRYLNAQPLDENGYMLRENNLPVYINVPITVVYEVGSERHSQKAIVPVRVRGKSYQLRYKTTVKRVETIKGSFSSWEDISAEAVITPSIPGLPEQVIAGPLNHGNFDLRIRTDIFKKPPDQKISHSYMKAFKLDLLFDFMGEQEDCHKHFESWGMVSSVVLPPKLEGKMQVSYPTNVSAENISIVITPNAHSIDGMESILGTHTFQFHLRRIAQTNCETDSNYHDIVLTINLEFTRPDGG